MLLLLLLPDMMPCVTADDEQGGQAHRTNARRDHQRRYPRGRRINVSQASMEVTARVTIAGTHDLTTKLPWVDVRRAGTSLGPRGYRFAPERTLTARLRCSRSKKAGSR